MKVDLHLHSPLSINNGDSINWESNKETIKTLYKNGVKMAAFTDHNNFKKDFYKELRDFALTGSITILPGVEVNVRRSGDQIAHLLILFSEKLSDKELQDIESKIKLLIMKRGVSIKTINELFNEYETIRIPHIGKGDHFKLEDLEILKYDAMEVTSLTHPNYLRCIREKPDSTTVAFSDTHIWEDYPQHRMLYTDIDIKNPTFDELKVALQKKRNYAKGILSD